MGVDQGQVHGVELGSPVLDDAGRAGPGHAGYTRFLSQVTLLVDLDQAIPVRQYPHGRAAWPTATRWPATAVVWSCVSVSANADVQEGDVLTTSGLEGVYPSGLPVARVVR